MLERGRWGPLAELRRGLGHQPGEVPSADRHWWAWTGQRLEDTDPEKWDKIHHLVATLFASHVVGKEPGDVRMRVNLAEALREVAKGKAGGSEGGAGSESVEKRFVALLGATFEDLDVPLRNAVALVKEFDVDFAQLFRDLDKWDDPNRRVQKEWAKRFWGTRGEGGKGSGAQEAEVPTLLEHANGFFGKLQDMFAHYDKEGNAGKLAALRRCLGRQPGEVPEAFPVLLNFLERDARGKRHRTWEKAHYLVAALFAAHVSGKEPRKVERRVKVAEALREVAKSGGGDGGSDSVEKRFVALLRARFDALDAHLTGALALVREYDVDFARLLHDLVRWEDGSRWVQQAWADQFWGTTEPKNQD